MPAIKIKNKETGKWEELPTVRGKSAYEIWLEQGNTGTEQDFLDSLKGADGETGPQGEQGIQGEKGDKGDTGATGSKGADGINGTDGVDGYSPTATVTQTKTGATITITDKNGTTITNITNGKDGVDGYTPVKGTDYWTEEDKEEIKEYVKGEIPTKTSQLTNDSGFLKEDDMSNLSTKIDNEITAREKAIATEKTERQNEIAVERKRIDNLLSLEEGSTTGDAELIDARTDYEGKTWSNVGNHIREITGRLIDACCDKRLESAENYNLLKISEVTFQHRLQNDSEELVSSNTFNAVSGWIPVEYGKYYTLSVLYNGERTTSVTTGSALWGRTHVKLADGTVLLIQQDNLVTNQDITNSWTTLKASIPDMVAIRFQMYFNANDISTAEKMKAFEPMLVEGNTAEEARNNSLTFPYVDGDTILNPEIYYDLKEDINKADKKDVEEIKNDIELLKQNTPNSVIIKGSPKYNDSYITNERFIRSIGNLRDTTKAKDIEISITNNSGKTIKNATIVVGLHNTVGINPNNNNLPFQVYDDIFSEPVGFKFFDGDKELPYYIESESDCNYIVDKNIKTDIKTMAIFSDGKIAVYNGTAERMQISSDDGVTWTNICENITSQPYRILLPDSQDNLFVASNDGYRLYKYTSTDGYMTGTQVIDMEADETQIGSVLAEDSDGNLYLGTYQSTPWHCVIRKSTDHGDTWNIVFDTTECQHVHNIFVNTKVTPNEIFIGLDNDSGKVQTHLSTDAGATWKLLDVPYRNNDNAFRYAGENFYIGCGERNILGGATLYKTSDYNNPEAYYTLFDNCQGIRDITNVIEGSDDVLIAGGCVDDSVRTQHLFLSEDRGETWKTVMMNPIYADLSPAGWGLRTFSHRNGQIISETSTKYAMRFVYGNGAKTILTVVNVGDIPTNGKTITLKTGYVANVEQMEEVLTSYEKIDGKVADINICDGYVVDKISNKRVLTSDTTISNSNIRIGQTSEVKILEDHAYQLKGSVNLGKLSRLNFTKGFTVSLLFKIEKSYEDYLADDKYHVIFQTGDTKLILWYRSLVLMSGTTNIFGKKLYLEDAYLWSDWKDYLRVTAYFSDDDLPLAGIYTNNTNNSKNIPCTEYPITENLNANDFIIGNALGTGYSDIPNIARIEIYNRVLSHGEIMSLTNGCNFITYGSEYN